MKRSKRRKEKYKIYGSSITRVPGSVMDLNPEFKKINLTFVQGDKNRSIRIILHNNCQLSQHHLLKMLSFFPLDDFSSLVKDQVTIGVRVHFCVLEFYSIYLPACHCTSTMPFLSQLLCSKALGQAW